MCPFYDFGFTNLIRYPTVGKKENDNTMTNTIQTFNSNNSGVRTVIDENKTTWWCAKDVCVVLGFRNSYEGTKYLDNDEITTYPDNSSGQIRHLKFVSDAGFLSLILRSRHPEAKKLKRWVTHDILPTIRKTGSFSVRSQSDLTEMDEEERLMVSERLYRIEKKLDMIAYALFNRKTIEDNADLPTIVGFARTLEGVNSMKVHSRLVQMGYLYRRGTKYKAFARYRDRLFRETYNPYFGTYDIRLTAEGRDFVRHLYRTGQLTMKKGWRCLESPVC